MDYVFAKDITTNSRRFKIGDPVGAADDLSPHTFSDLGARGFIAAKKADQPAAAQPRPRHHVKDED